MIKCDGLVGVVVDLLVGNLLLMIGIKRWLLDLILLIGNCVVDIVSLFNFGVLDSFGEGV